MCCLFFFFKQKTAYEMRISDWSSDVCSSDLEGALLAWQARVMDLARGSGTRTDWSKITDGRFVRELASLSVREDGPKRAIEMLNSAGVRVVVERHLPKTYLDGAAMLLEIGRAHV